MMFPNGVHGFFFKTPVCMFQVDTIIIASKLKKRVITGLMCRSVFTQIEHAVRHLLKYAALLGFLEKCTFLASIVSIFA